MASEGFPPGRKMLWWNAMEGLDGIMGPKERCKGCLMPAWVGSGVPEPLQHFPATRKPPSSHRLGIPAARNSSSWASCVQLQLPWLGAEREEQGKVISDANSHQLSCFLQLFPLQGLETPKKSRVLEQESAEISRNGLLGNQTINQFPQLNLLIKPSPNWRGRRICQPNSSCPPPGPPPRLPLYTLRRQREDQLMLLLPACLLMGMPLTVEPEKPWRPNQLHPGVCTQTLGGTQWVLQPPDLWGCPPAPGVQQ